MSRSSDNQKKSESKHSIIRSSDHPIIGCLALQGAVEVHRPHIEAAGAEFRVVKTPKQFEQVDAFILPGGESTTMLKLIDTFGLWDALADEFARKPVWGICAGSILLAEKVFVSPSSRANPAKPWAKQEKSRDLMPDEEISPLPRIKSGVGRDDMMREIQKSFGLVPVTVQRNGYGRQVDSHHGEIDGYEVSFIRAPVITDAGECTVKASHNGDPVWVEHGQYMLTTFHPELTLDFPSPMHKAFVDLAGQNT